MTSAVGVDGVTQDIVALATKATEIFLADFACRAYDRASDDNLDYGDIQELVHDDPRYEFLIDTIPKKIKFSEAAKLAQEAREREATFRIESEARREAKRLELAKKKEQQQLQQQLNNVDSNNVKKEQDHDTEDKKTSNNHHQQPPSTSPTQEPQDSY